MVNLSLDIHNEPIITLIKCSLISNPSGYSKINVVWLFLVIGIDMESIVIGYLLVSIGLVISPSLL